MIPTFRIILTSKIILARITISTFKRMSTLKLIFIWKFCSLLRFFSNLENIFTSKNFSNFEDFYFILKTLQDCSACLCFSCIEIRSHSNSGVMIRSQFHPNSAVYRQKPLWIRQRSLEIRTSEMGHLLIPSLILSQFHLLIRLLAFSTKR